VGTGGTTCPDTSRRSAVEICRSVLRWLAGIFFVLAGVNHFVHPAVYREIVPPGFPNPALLVAISGVCEIVGGVGLDIRPLRRAAGWGLIALLLAVFPANIYMALAPPGALPGLGFPRWLVWLRLPFQVLFIAWVWFVALQQPRAPSAANGGS
jgi:uncharacterized membrane protein